MSSDPRGKPGPVVPLLRVCGLQKRYWRRSALWRKSTPVLAVNAVDFEIAAGKTLALAGSSGSGKSTVARCVACLEKPDDGEIWIAGNNVAKLKPDELRANRGRVQLVFQDAATSINPRFSAEEVIEEPLLIQRQGGRDERRDRARALMQEVGLSADWADRRATNFSGGQQQRLAIARALALSPQLLVLDEALSGLDLSTQAQIANLLLELQSARSLTYLLISHDLGLIARMADDVAVMAAGKVVERGLVSQVMANPSHAETQTLVRSAKTSQKNLSLALGAHA
jgi:ABC-type glutathione transport system ATPase component